jgi:hypothetical protein
LWLEWALGILEVTMLKAAISDHANGRLSGCRRLALIAAGVLALLGSFAATAPAQAGYYGYDGYGYRAPCSYGCGGYRPYHYGCSSCGCYRHCYSGSRGYVYERRYVEREYVERRYGCCRHHYGYYPYGGYRRDGYYPSGDYGRPFPYGYGGVRYWRPPYGYSRFDPIGDRYGDGYEDAPRPPEPIVDRYDY